MIDQPAFEQLCESIAAVPDPEVPVLTIADLGVLRSIDRDGDRIVVTITPTYSGCPAMAYIADGIRSVLAEAGADGEVLTVFSPAWTTDWMTPAGRRKLVEFGIAPPTGTAAVSIGASAGSVPAHSSLGGGGSTLVNVRDRVACPRCDSKATVEISEFGSTACKALYRCETCKEPFDYFKEI